MTIRDCQHPGQPHKHGTTSGPRFDQCKCEPCLESIRVWARRRYRLIAYGTWQPYVPSQPARDHIAALRDAGLSLKRIQAAAGVSESTIQRIVYGISGPPIERVRPETEQKILAVPVPDVAPRQYVPATGTIRRITALHAVGWSLQALGDAIGMDRRNLAGILRQPNVTPATEARVRELYDDLWDRKPPTVTGVQRQAYHRALNHARRMGWAPPLAWDDDTIDDPATVPAEWRDVTWRGKPRTVRPPGVFLSDAEFLTEAGENLEGAARRLGMSTATLKEMLQSRQRSDLIQRLCCRDRAAS